MFIAVHYLLGREYDVDQVFTQRAGQDFFQKAQILFCLVLIYEAQRFLQVGDDPIATAAHKAAVDMAAGVLIRPPAATQFVDFFLVHKGTSQ